ncbi:MAG: sigma-54-dependent Fis family transcriptional regulator, partial [Treponema sp.]|nr:sigma-54-dependent Fis family transcriptional regulator [Treponema sp.]
VREGRFREDLYYRLNVLRLTLPPLRERAADIPLLAGRLLARLAARMGKSAHTLSPGAVEKLLAYSFPGNIRELENILERALIYSEGPDIQARDLDLHRGAPADPPEPPPFPAASGEGQSLENIEREAIIAALARTGGNRTKAAEELGISRKTILNKIRAYGIDGDHEPSGRH